MARCAFFIRRSLGVEARPCPSLVRVPRMVAHSHARNTEAQRIIHILYVQASPPPPIDLKSVEEGPSSALFSTLDIVAGGTLFISFGLRFKAPQEESTGQGCRPEASRGPG